MTRDEMIEKIAAELWRVQVIAAGAQPSVVRGRTPEAFSESSDEIRRLYLRQAAAVLDLCGPKPLVWKKDGRNRWVSLRYIICDSRKSELYRGFIWGEIARGWNTPEPSFEAAQDAAQAHYAAAHWANTPMGDV